MLKVWCCIESRAFLGVNPLASDLYDQHLESGRNIIMVPLLDLWFEHRNCSEESYVLFSVFSSKIYNLDLGILYRCLENCFQIAVREPLC